MLQINNRRAGADFASNDIGAADYGAGDYGMAGRIPLRPRR